MTELWNLTELLLLAGGLGVCHQDSDTLNTVFLASQWCLYLDTEGSLCREVIDISASHFSYFMRTATCGTFLLRRDLTDLDGRQVRESLGL